MQVLRDKMLVSAFQTLAAASEMTHEYFCHLYGKFKHLKQFGTGSGKVIVIKERLPVLLHHLRSQSYTFCTPHSPLQSPL